MTESKLQWSISQGGEIWVVRALDDETQEAFLERVNALKVAVLGDTPEIAQATTKSVVTSGHVAVSEKSFVVESLKLASGGDHPRWVVKGGNFKKFGVTCWPETLEAAGLKNLDPLKEHTPSGSWTAFYQEQIKDGKAVPDKVVRLVRG